MIGFVGVGRHFGEAADWAAARAVWENAAEEIARAGADAGETEEEQIRWLFSGGFYEVTEDEEDAF